MRDRKKRNIMIASLCCLLVFMGIGYALLTQILTINGTATLTGSWDIKITGIETAEIVGTASNELEPSYTDDTATFSVGLKKPGDKIKYIVRVENQGSIDAVLSLNSTTPTPHKDIKFTNDLVSGEILYHKGIEQEELDKGIIDSDRKSIREIEVWVEFNENATTLTTGEISEYKIELTYTQYDGNSFYEPPKDVETDNGVFQVSADGTILDYNEELGTSVSIPAEIDGIKIKRIENTAFRESTTIVIYNYDLKVALTSEGVPQFAVLFNEDVRDELMELTDGTVPVYSVGDSNIPELSEGVDYGYFNYSEDLLSTAPVLETDSNFLGEKSVQKNLGKLTIKSLDLSNAINLEYIDDYAFTNATQEMTEDELNSLETGLTSLIFGNNTNEINLGKGVFAGANLGTLKTYSTIKSNVSASESKVSSLTEIILLFPFANSKIANLIIEPTDTERDINFNNLTDDDQYSGDLPTSVISTYSYVDLNSLYISNGIEKITDSAFYHSKINNVYLPNTLFAIDDGAFYLCELIEVTIPKSVTTIGIRSFAGNSELNIYMSGRKNLNGMTLGSGWNGTATINYLG